MGSSIRWVPPHLLRPENCPCQKCAEWRQEQEVKRVANVINNWRAPQK